MTLIIQTPADIRRWVHYLVWRDTNPNHAMLTRPTPWNPIPIGLPLTTPGSLLRPNWPDDIRKRAPFATHILQPTDHIQITSWTWWCQRSDRAWVLSYTKNGETRIRTISGPTPAQAFNAIPQ